MRFRGSLSNLVFISLLLILPAKGRSGEGLEVVAELQQAPGNIAISPDGRIFLSLHPFFTQSNRVVEILDNGQTVPYPNADWNRTDGPPDSTLDSVLGIAADTSGTIWMLDTGKRRGTTPRLIGWSSREEKLHRIIELAPPVTPRDAFVNDLAIDPRNHAIYVADPAGGSNAALIVVDLTRGTARRILEGHESLIPESIDLTVEDQSMTQHVGINPIALDPLCYWLYYGPMHGTSLYRIRTADLCNEYMDDQELSGRIDKYSSKPICDGIATDRAGNIYLGDLAKNAIGVITRVRAYSILIEDSRLSWVDAFALHPEGSLWAVTNQLHHAPRLNDGVDRTERPFLIFRFDPVPPGTYRR